MWLSSLHWAGLNFQIAANLIVAVICGCSVGIERSSKGRQAGVRTYALVSLASACLMCAISQEASPGSIGDPASRVIQGLLTGLGFLGAGVIIQDGINIKGLTTAASIWLTSGIGIMAGLGLWGLAFFSTFFALLILAGGFKTLEAKITKDHYALVNIKLPPETNMGEADVKAMLLDAGLTTVSMAFKRDAKKRVEFEMTALYTKNESPNRLAQKLIAMNGDIDAFEISSSPE